MPAWAMERMPQERREQESQMRGPRITARG